MKGKILVIGGVSKSLVNFRKAMLKAMLAKGYQVSAAAGEVDEHVVAELDSMGVTFIPTTVRRRGLNPISDVAYVKALVRIIRRVRPDIVLTYTAKPVIWGTLAAAWCGVPNIAAMITGAGAARPASGRWSRLRARLVQRLFSVALPRATIVFFQNLDDEFLFRNRGLLGETPSIVIPGSGVDLKEFTPSPAPEGPVVFLMVARLIVEKGVREFGHAAAKLRKIEPSARCRLVGPIQKRGGIAAEDVARWQAEGSLEYVGAVKDVRPYLEKAAVFVLPSYYGEGVPRTILEAMACGRPVITTNHPGCRDPVVHGTTGFIIPPRDPDALVAAMVRLARNRMLIDEMGHHARVRAEEVYDVNRVNEMILAGLGIT